MFSYCKRHDIAFNLTFMVIILFMKFSTSVNLGYREKNINSSNLLRFQDFEPRRNSRTDTEIVTVSRQTQIAQDNKRKSRGFQFHADDKDVIVDLEFIVPFVRIPIERSMTMSKAAIRNLLDLNLNSLLTTGAVVAVGGIFAIILKIVFSSFPRFANGFKKTLRDSGESFPYPYEYNNATDDTTTSIPNNLIDYMESKLQESNVDPSKCIQKMLCEYGQKNIAEFRSRSAGNINKIIDGILSLKAVHNIMRGTAVQKALEAAKMGNNCTSKYGDCKWAGSAQRAIKMITKLMKYFNVR